jgi:hypothetical protein
MDRLLAVAGTAKRVTRGAVLSTGLAAGFATGGLSVGVDAAWAWITPRQAASASDILIVLIAVLLTGE